MLAGSSVPWWEYTCCAWVLSSLYLQQRGLGILEKSKAQRRQCQAFVSLAHVFTSGESKHQILRTMGRVEETPVSRRICNPK